MIVPKPHTVEDLITLIKELHPDLIFVESQAHLPYGFSEADKAKLAAARVTPQPEV